MDWQERIFKRSFLYFKHSLKRKHYTLRKDRRVVFGDQRGSMSLLARALSGESLELVPTKSHAGWAGHYLFFPHAQDQFLNYQDNVAYYRFMVFYLCAQRKLGLNWRKKDGSFDKEQAVDMAAQAEPAVLEALFADFPKMREVRDELLKQWDKSQGPMPTAVLHGSFLPPIYFEEKVEKHVDRGQYVDEKEANVEEVSEVESNNHSIVSNLEVDEQAQDDFVLMHQFEKVETLEEFKGTWRDFDGTDEMDEHEDALKDLDMEHTVRVDTPVHSVFQTDFLINTSVAESADTALAGGISYDEWDFSKFTYRKEHCTVFPKIAQSQVTPIPDQLVPKEKVVNELRSTFNKWLNEREQVKAQVDGFDLDLDAMVCNHATIAAGHTPNERLYLSKRNRAKDMALVILIDSSLSADSFTDGQRILDIEKSAVLALGEVLEEYGVKFQIDAFSSNTRNNCSYTTLKGFNAPWKRSKGFIAGHRPIGYTRIGPAIRHATNLLENTQARDKWILLLSDGKPNDYDRYEGLYGMEDVKRALQEATQMGMFTHALAVDRKGRFYLPQMFGHQSFSLLKNIHDLPKIMGDVVAKQLSRG